MERSPQEVTNAADRGGWNIRPWGFRAGIALCIVCAVTPRVWSQTADFLVVEHVNRLTVYNSYQQAATAVQRNVLRPFFPMKILALHTTLGDGLTPCAKVEAGGETFYLLRDDRGNLFDPRAGGMNTVFKSATILMDTVKTARPGVLTAAPPGGGAAEPLGAGERCIRYFEWNGRQYCARLNAGVHFAWCVFPAAREGRWWTREIAVAPPVALSPRVVERIQTRLRDANRALTRIFTVLNAETNRRLSPPQWSIAAAGGGLSCRLQPGSLASSYGESITAMRAVIETYLLGTGFGAEAVENRIEIRPR